MFTNFNFRKWNVVAIIISCSFLCGCKNKNDSSNPPVTGSGSEFTEMNILDFPQILNTFPPKINRELKEAAFDNEYKKTSRDLIFSKQYQEAISYISKKIAETTEVSSEDEVSTEYVLLCLCLSLSDRDDEAIKTAEYVMKYFGNDINLYSISGAYFRCKKYVELKKLFDEYHEKRTIRDDFDMEVSYRYCYMSVCIFIKDYDTIEKITSEIENLIKENKEKYSDSEHNAKAVAVIEEFKKIKEESKNREVEHRADKDLIIILNSPEEDDSGTQIQIEVEFGFREKKSHLINTASGKNMESSENTHEAIIPQKEEIIIPEIPEISP